MGKEVEALLDLYSLGSHAQKCRKTFLGVDLKPRHLWRHFWHPKNPLVEAVVPIKLRTSVRSGTTAADFYDISDRFHGVM
jgi:hypothetical protein